jgi:hypothetical protein
MRLPEIDHNIKALQTAVNDVKQSIEYKQTKIKI